MAPAVNSGKVASKSILKNLIHTPYNFTFGLFLLADYALRKDEFKDVEGSDKMLHDCAQSIDAFDMYRVCGAKLLPEEMVELLKAKKECAEFSKAVRSKESSLSGVEDKI